MTSGSPHDVSYRSGRWRGYYVQNGSRARMALTLTFEGGAVAGGGLDRVGEFYVHGSCGPGGAVDFVKQYVGRHAVRYVGKRAGNGIRGSWRMLRIFRGEFHIWPVTGDVAESSVDIEAAVGR